MPQVAVGVLPLGTGNDMARVLGWGSAIPGDLLAKGMHGMRRWLGDVARAVPIWTDLWRVTVEVDGDSGGRIVEVKGGVEQAMASGTTRREFVMINYVSLGDDAHVVFNVEKKRQATPMANRFMYAVQSMWRTVQVDAPVTDTLASVALDGHQLDLSALGSQRCLAFLNISSYSGGVPIWSVAARPAATSPLSGAPFAPKAPANQGDGCMEVVSIRSLPQLGVAVGMAWATPVVGGIQKVGQVTRVNVDFQLGRQSSLYMQVDGEGMRLEHPRRIVIEHLAKAQALVLPPQQPRLRRGATTPW